jgi:oxygen-dependent protoporphyrinogen oxidase
LHDLEHTHGSVMKAMGEMLRAGRGPGGPAGPTLVSFKGGLQEITDALARELRPELRFTARTTQIRLGPKGWTVSAAYQAAELYDAVIYAAPAHCADEVDFAFEGADRVKTLASIDHPPVAVLALGFRREDVAHKLDGFGFLVPDVERRNVLGVIFSSTVFPGRAPEGHVLLTAFVGGARNPDLANADLSTLTARVFDDLRLLLGVRGEPTFRAFHLWPKAIPQYTLSHSRFKEIMDDAERRNPGFALAGSYRDGVAMGEVIASAGQAADRIAAHIGAGDGAAGQ